MNRRFLQSLLIAFMSITFVPVGFSAPISKEKPPQVIRDEFFIVSEVTLAKHQVVMEEPTQTTVTMNVNDKTVFMNEQGHAIPIKDMQAGDTVYVTYERGADGVITALSIRMGPMTVQELHRRYFHG